MMKKIALFLACVLAGCADRPAEPAKKPNVTTAMSRPKTDPARQAAEVLRQATEPSQFREAVSILNPVLDAAEAQATVQLNDKQREFLQKDAHLAADELAEVEANVARPADAYYGYYLEECSLLRDAAQALEVGGLTLPEQARLCLHWVGRNVLLQAQGQDWPPNAFVLKRGHGDARARALIFLALMRQFQSGKRAGDHPAEGCVLVVPGEDATPLLVGVFDDTGKELYLFDPRLAEPVFKEGRTVATLKDVQQDPALLKRAGLTSGQAKELEARLVCPLPALSPRMKELERILGGQDRLKLYLDAEALQKKLAEALSVPVRVWNEPPDKGGKVPNSPTRALRMFLPVEEGGVDRSAPPRLLQFVLRQTFWPSVEMNLEQLRLTHDLVEPARVYLMQTVLANLFKRYYLQPAEFLLHGKYDPMLGRLDRIRPFLDDESLTTLAKDRNFPYEVASWRDKARSVYLAVLNRDTGAKEREAAFWNEDRYLWTLLSDAEDAAEQGRRLKELYAQNLKDAQDRRDREARDKQLGPEGVKKLEERDARKANESTLTRIVAYSCREALEQRSAWLLASCWQEKAERAQAALHVDKGSAAALKARKTWLNARGAWNIYLGRLTLSPVGLRQRLEPVNERLRANEPERALNLLEALHLDLQRYYVAKLSVSEALARLEGNKAAEAYLQNVGQEMDGLLAAGQAKNGQVGSLSPLPEIDRLHQLLGTIPNPALRAHLQQRSEFLTRDWAKDGPFACLRLRFEIAGSRQ